MLREGILPVRVPATEPAIATYNFFMNPPADLNDSESSDDEEAGDERRGCGKSLAQLFFCALRL